MQPQKLRKKRAENYQRQRNERNWKPVFDANKMLIKDLEIVLKIAQGEESVHALAKEKSRERCNDNKEVEESYGSEEDHIDNENDKEALYSKKEESKTIAQSVAKVEGVRS